jgi:hypothetical protein
MECVDNQYSIGLLWKLRPSARKGDRLVSKIKSNATIVMRYLLEVCVMNACWEEILTVPTLRSFIGFCYWGIMN